MLTKIIFGYIHKYMVKDDLKLKKNNNFKALKKALFFEYSH